jgi:signal peptidase I
MELGGQGAISLGLILLIAQLAGLWKLFEKSGRRGWEALIPVYNYYLILKLTGRPVWWLVPLLIPVINFIVLIGLRVDFVKSYGKNSGLDHALAVLLPFIVYPLWGFDKKTSYLGASASEDFKEKYPYKKSATREWVDAVVFAVVAATLIRMFFIEAYTIPTGSMEKSLLVGDFLFVSKVNYGPRLPMTPVAFPFAHHTMPVTGTKAYWDGIQWKYRRLPGLNAIRRGDVVVFNYPEGDTVILETQESQSYYQAVQMYGRSVVRSNPGTTIVSRPVDKRENYIKRCQAIPGDTLRLINGQVYVNGKAAENSPTSQTEYIVQSDGTDFNPETLADLGISYSRSTDNYYSFTMTQEQSREIAKWANVKSVDKYIPVPPGVYDPSVFPHDKHFKWNQDNFGPVIVPKAGWTVKLDSTTLPLYRRAIEVYEGNTFQVKGADIFINGSKADRYTFKMDYYWMMGDNRHNSLDSRFWGFVPVDHIVGKALFVWMSWDSTASGFSKIRWNRIFMGIKGY